VEWTVYDYAASLNEVFSEDTCQKIEHRSHAVLIRDGGCRLIIQGSDQLHVLLALSIVEDIVARFETNIGDSSKHSSSAMVDINKVLERAYSNDDEVENSFDWSSMPEEVKRAVLVSLIDSDVSEAAGVDVKSVSDVQAVSEESLPAETVTGTGATASVGSMSSSMTASRRADWPSRTDISDPVNQPLVRLAKSKGYSEEEIERVLSAAGQWKESAFLRTLYTNRRIQQSSVSETLQQHESIVRAPPKVADKYAHTFALANCATGSNDAAASHRVSTNSIQRANAEGICMEVDEVNGDDSITVLDDSVILLKSDFETDSSDDDDNENLEIEKEKDDSLRYVPSNVGALPNEQAQKTALVQSGASPRQRKKKKKRKKKKANLVNPNPAVHQPAAEQLPVMKTGTDINDLDAISLMPASSSSSTTVVLDDEMIVDDSSDSDVVIEVPENDASMKPVLSRKEKRQLAQQKQAQSQPPIMRPRITSTSSNTFRYPRRRDFPTPRFVSVPTVTGNLHTLLSVGLLSHFDVIHLYQIACFINI